MPCCHFSAILIYKTKCSYYKCASKTTHKALFLPLLTLLLPEVPEEKKQTPPLLKKGTYICIYQFNYIWTDKLIYTYKQNHILSLKAFNEQNFDWPVGRLSKVVSPRQYDLPLVWLLIPHSASQMWELNLCFLEREHCNIIKHENLNLNYYSSYSSSVYSEKVSYVAKIK